MAFQFCHPLTSTRQSFLLPPKNAPIFTEEEEGVMKISTKNYSKPSLRRWTTFVVRDDQSGCIYLRELVDNQMGAIFLKISGFYSIQKAHQYARSIRSEYRK
ncbi:MAG: hypothetical protein ACRCU2_17310, partial [Planktothrix sp.]